MYFGKLTVAGLVLGAACSSVEGVVLSSNKKSIRDGLTTFPAEPLSDFVLSTPMRMQRHLPMSQRLIIQSRSFSQSAAYPQCTTSSARSLGAADACVVCLNDETCDETTCVAGRPEGVSESQFFVCPVGECCVRAIFDSSDELDALVIDGLVYEDGEATADASKCPSCVFSVRELTCEEVAVPKVDAAEGATVECTGSSDGVAAGSTPESTVTSAPAATRAPAVTESTVTSAPAATRAPAVTRAPASTRVSSPTAAPVEEEGESSTCFPADASVELEHGGLVRMDALSIGDSVKVGANKYSKVFMFTHKMADVSVEVVVLRTASGAALSLTGSHYIYANDALVSAGSVKVGDELALGDGGKSIVISVSRESSRGLYNPQTLSGDIVVNGVVASTYTTAVDPGFAHFVLAPMRALSHLGLRYTGLESGGGCIAGFTPHGSTVVS